MAARDVRFGRLSEPIGNRAREAALEVRLAADPNVESEEQKRPEQGCCNYGQHPGRGPERIEVVVDCGDDDADDDPDGDDPEREERWPEPHDLLMLPHAPKDGRSTGSQRLHTAPDTSVTAI